MGIKIFHHYWQLPLALLALVDALIFFGAPYAATGFGSESGLNWLGVSAAPSVAASGVFALATFLAMTAMGLYNARQRSRLAGLLARVAASILAGMVVTAVVLYLLPELRFGRNVLLFASLIAFCGSALLRIVFDRVANQDIFKRRVLVYGAGRRALSIAKLRRRSDRRGFVVVGYVAADGDDPSGVNESDRIGCSDSLRDVCRRLRVDEIVVAMDDRRRQFPMEELLECRLDGLEVTELVSFLERETGKVRLDVLNPSWMIFSNGFQQGRVQALLERVFDVIAGVMLLVVALPVMLLVTVAIKLMEGIRAPIFYQQVRVGQYGRPFKLLKFRSMRMDAESDGLPRWAEENDTRVTFLGAFMRKTRLDELPQIVNVLRGEMSFVGPRPERPEFVERLNECIPYYRERHSIKPGITGWAQLCYPYGSSEQDAVEKLQYDLYYVKNHSLLFYLAILVQTVEVILWAPSVKQAHRTGTRGEM